MASVDNALAVKGEPSFVVVWAHSTWPLTFYQYTVSGRRRRKLPFKRKGQVGLGS